MSVIDDQYYTLGKESVAELKDRGSKFICYAYPVHSLDGIEFYLDQIRNQHPKSNHVCYAYCLGIDRTQKRSNDDGEPSGTAGKPIYNRILSHDLSDCLLATVRYFGGTKLGTSGLIKAYKESAEAAILNNEKKKKFIRIEYLLKFNYAIMGDLLNHLKQLDISILQKNLTETPSIKISLRKSLTEQKLNELKGRLLAISADRVNEKTIVAGLKIELC